MTPSPAADRLERDLSRSRAILIANTKFDQRSGIPDLPTAKNCIPAMKALLTSDLCGWPADRVEGLQDSATPSELAVKLHSLIQDVQDVLLLYYVGYGIRTLHGQLALTLRDSNTSPELLPYTAMLYSGVADILRSCPAATKLVILDCCQAEFGNEENFQTQSADIDAEPVDGLYFISASDAWENARSPTGSQLPYFTDEFIQVVRVGIPYKAAELTVQQIFVELRARLRQADRPEPVQSGTRDAGGWVFSSNAAPRQTHRDPEQEIVVLQEQKAAAESAQQALQAEINSLVRDVERLGRRIAETRLQSEAGQEQLERDLRTAQVRLGDASKAQAEAREAADAAGQAVADLVRGSAGDSGLTEAAFPMLRSLPSQPSQQAAEWSREDTPDEQPDPQSIATDWRVTVTFDDWGLIRQVLRRLRERQIIGDVRRRLGPRVRKGVRDPNLYLYVGSRPVAVALGDVMTEMIAERHVRASVRIHYWNSVDPDWEWLAPATLDVAGKERLTEQRQELEHEYEVTLDANMSRLSGLATWEVRITLRSRSDAVMLTQQLQESGHLVLRQRKRVLIGAESQDEANELAESVKGNAPPGARFAVAPLTSMATKAKHGVSETWLANLDSL